MTVLLPSSYLVCQGNINLGKSGMDHISFADGSFANSASRVIPYLLMQTIYSSQVLYTAMNCMTCKHDFNDHLKEQHVCMAKGMTLVTAWNNRSRPKCRCRGFVFGSHRSPYSVMGELKPY